MQSTRLNICRTADHASKARIRLRNLPHLRHLRHRRRRRRAVCSLPVTRYVLCASCRVFPTCQTLPLFALPVVVSLSLSRFIPILLFRRAKETNDEGEKKERKETRRKIKKDNPVSRRRRRYMCIDVESSKVSISVGQRNRSFGFGWTVSSKKTEPLRDARIVDRPHRGKWKRLVTEPYRSPIESNRFLSLSHTNFHRLVYARLLLSNRRFSSSSASSFYFPFFFLFCNYPTVRGNRCNFASS